jgi:hypothetical protein
MPSSLDPYSIVKEQPLTLPSPLRGEGRVRGIYLSNGFKNFCGQILISFWWR